MAPTETLTEGGGHDLPLLPGGLHRTPGSQQLPDLQLGTSPLGFTQLLQLC